MPATLVRVNERHAFVSGYGLYYGDDGSGHPCFRPETDLMPRLVPSKIVMLEHGGDPLGVIVSDKPDKIGRRILARLDLTRPGVIALLPEIQAGMFGWSFGAMLALVRHDGKWYERCAIYEYSLHRHPRDWRQLGVPYTEQAKHTAPLPAGDGHYLVARNGALFEHHTKREVSLPYARALAEQGASVSILCEDGSFQAPPGFSTMFINLRVPQ